MKSKLYLILILLGISLIIWGIKLIPTKYNIENQTQIIKDVIESKIVFDSKDIKKENIINYDEIYNYYDPLVNNSKNDEYSILITGDVMLGREVNIKLNKFNDYRYPFKNVLPLLNKSDVVLINLESPILEKCPLTNEGMIFCTDIRASDGLIFNSTTVANLANNHIRNYGKKGILDTVYYLEKNKIKTIGLKNSLIVKIKDKKFGFLGYSQFDKNDEIVSEIDIEKIKMDIKALKNEVDHIIVTFHWGEEYKALPNNYQKNIAYRTIDAGADLIVGNHSHWTQPIEIYNNKLIAYSHGNFVFDQLWSQKTREGIIGKYIFDKNGFKKVEYYPIFIDNNYFPIFSNEAQSRLILKSLKNSSDLLNNKL